MRVGGPGLELGECAGYLVAFIPDALMECVCFRLAVVPMCRQPPNCLWLQVVTIGDQGH